MSEFSKSFTKIAQFYDELMSNVSYKEWVDYAVSFLNIFNIKKEKFLDLACGTIIPTIYLSEYCEKIVGVDKSIEMLKVAKRKIEKLNSKKISLVLSDIREFHFKWKFDAIFCFFDSMNYLLNIDDLYKSFYCAYQNLKSRGIFLFDMNSIFALKELWDTRKDIKIHKNFISIWENEWIEEEKISKLVITIEWKENGKERYVREVHFEKAYHIDEVVDTLKKAGFEEVNVYEHLKYSLPNSYTTRIQYVALK
ncbi:MAG: class I SAM-dependent methyltransferase [Candidatus Hydrothermales bacterium]